MLGIIGQKRSKGDSLADALLGERGIDKHRVGCRDVQSFPDNSPHEAREQKQLVLVEDFVPVGFAVTNENHSLAHRFFVRECPRVRRLHSHSSNDKNKKLNSVGVPRGSKKLRGMPVSYLAHTLLFIVKPEEGETASPKIELLGHSFRA